MWRKKCGDFDTVRYRYEKILNLVSYKHLGGEKETYICGHR